MGIGVSYAYNANGQQANGDGLMTANATGQSVQLSDNSSQVSTGNPSTAVTAAANGEQTPR